MCSWWGCGGAAAAGGVLELCRGDMSPYSPSFLPPLPLSLFMSGIKKDEEKFRFIFSFCSSSKTSKLRFSFFSLSFYQTRTDQSIQKKEKERERGREKMIVIKSDH